MIVKVTVLVPVPLALVAERMTLLYVPAVVGVPEIDPLFEGPVRPGGLLVAPQLPLGMVWFAVIWYESATPTVPVLSPLVMVGAGVGVGAGPMANAGVASDMARALPIAKAVILHGL